jgi:hypothetical protein
MDKVNEIVVYQPDEIVNLEVRVENESVWLTQQQMSVLFQRDRTVITRHINNVFSERELEEKSNVQILHFANSDKPIKFYSLDVIISVGYRVKSQRGTQFRIWANQVLKDYLLRGYAVNTRLTQLEQRVDKKLLEHEQRISNNEKQIGFFVRTALPPVEGVFCDGQIFDAYIFASDLVKSAKTSLVLIDNYVDESVLLLLSKRKKGVSALIFTKGISQTLQQDIDRHNLQYEPIEIKILTNVHDRFLFVDDIVYHIGASLKDLGKRLFAFSKMELKGKELLKKL